MRIRHLAVILSCAILLAGAGCTKPEEKVTPTLNLTALQDQFINGTAYLTLSLTSAAETDIILTLSASGNFDTSLLSFQNPIAIPAGSTSAALLVIINDQTLQPGSYTATITVTAAAGAKLGLSSVTLRHTVRKNMAEINLSGPERFTDGKATLTLTPDVPPLTPVTVTLEVLKFGASEGKQLIPAGAVTCPETVVLPADQASPTTFTVRVDLSQLKPVESEAIIAIKNVSGGGVIGTADEVRLGAKGTLQAHLRSDWQLSYAGDFPREDQGGVMKSYVQVNGFSGENGSGFYLRWGDAGYVSRYFSSVTEYLQDVEDKVAAAMGKDKPYPILHSNDRYDFVRLPVGSYEYYMVGCDSQGHLTGDYARVSFTRAPTEAMKKAYSEWLGEWEVNGQAWRVNCKEENASYYIQGIGGVWRNPGFPAYIGWDGELEIRGEEYLSFSDDDWYSINGIYTTDKRYYSTYTGPVAKAVTSDDWYGYAQWSACTNPSTGQPFERMDMYNNTGSPRWSNVLQLPEFMSRAHEGELPQDAIADARYAPMDAFGGDWVFQNEELTLSPGTHDSYNIYLVVDEEPTSIKVMYDADGGFAYIQEQILYELTYNANSKWAVALCGAWYDSDKGKLFPYFPYVSPNPGTTIARLFMRRDGTVSWDTAQVGNYWLYAIGFWAFVWSNDHSVMNGSIGWIEDPVELIGGEAGIMRRP